ncbi:VanZ family protein [Microbacterium terricola]|uniref:VanZ family protein n=1 Tax=Microbacterium terricola TaxID=344163 RepID=A0ABM8DXM3_9MICO|nr:VanZ family protein [Microbacterium terricola]UYK38961.1 VanZ family protein [Microbacterium terricola]BDV30339.1 VanZ family protein [Microbacterium terricola]
MTGVSAPLRTDGGLRSRLAGLFGVYLVLLAWLVLWKLDIPWVGGVDRVIKLVPFVAGNGLGSSAPSEVLANLVLFLPFGVHLGLLAPSWRWWRVLATAAGASLALEVTQYVLAVGSSDITDVIMNSAGGLLGFGALTLIRRRLRGKTAAVMSVACAIGTVLAVLAVAWFLAMPLHYGPPPGGIAPPRG